MASTGDLIADRYRLVRPLGAGAMGQVWLADDELLHRQVAVKQLLLDASQAQPADIERAKREARLASRLNHPHAVGVHDLLMVEGRPVLVMEYVDGQTLAQLVRARGRLAPDEAARIIGQVADALAAAHALDIVHRDIKPGNILVSSVGRAKLADFGIARSGTDTSLTGTGTMMGTLAYMAPEIADGSPASKATDVWSLGATLYFAVEGRPPFEGGTPVELLVKLVRDPVRAPAHAGPVASLIERLMDRDHEARPPASQAVGAIDMGGGPAASGFSSSTASAPTLVRTYGFTADSAGIDLAKVLASSAPTYVGAAGSNSLDSVSQWADRAATARVAPDGYGTLYVTNGRDGTLSVIEPGTLSVARRLTVARPGSELWAVVIPPGAPDEGTICVADAEAGAVSAITPGGSGVMRAVSVGLPSPRLDVIAIPAGCPGEGAVGVVNDAAGTLTLIEPGSSIVSRPISVGEEDSMLWPVVVPAGAPGEGTIYVTNSREGSVSVITPGDSAVARRIDIGPPDSTLWLAVAPAGTPGEGSIYVANGTDGVLSVIAPGDLGVSRTIAVGEAPLGLWPVVVPAGAPGAGSVYVTNGSDGTVSVIEPGHTQVGRTIAVGSKGSLFWPVVVPAAVPGEGSVIVIDDSTGCLAIIEPGGIAVNRTIELGARSKGGLDVVVAPAGAPGEGTIYVTNDEAGTVSVIPPFGRATTASVMVGHGDLSLALFA